MLLVVAALAVVGGSIASSLARDDADRPPDRATTSTTEAPTTSLTGEPGTDGVGDPYFPLLGNGGYDVQHYTLELTWLPEDGSLVGTTTIEASATQDLSRFDLDLSGLDVISVVVEGKTAEVARVDRELVVTPPSAIASGTSFTTVVSYAGEPRPVNQGTDLFDVGWQTDGREAFVVSEPAGAATFFPVNDHPSDKATYTLKVTAPADQVVAANGLLVAQEDVAGEQRRWTYEAREPMASYLVQIAIGDYELVDAGMAGPVTIRHAFHRSASPNAAAATARTAEMIDVLDDVFGPFPFEAYGVLVVDEPLGFALETQTLTLIGTDIAAEGRGAEEVLLHELAHQWVGDAVSPATWQDIWLNEGFATYSEWLWSERTGGASAAQLARSFAGSGGLDLPPGDPGNQELFSRTVYRRGGMTLQALREAIGDDAFFTVLTRWVDEHRHGSASTADFIALCEEVSGQQLDDLFERWLYEPSLPSLATGA